MLESKSENETRITINVPLILIVRGVSIFLCRQKRAMGSGFFDPQIGRKVEAPSKNLQKSPITVCVFQADKK